MSSARRLLAPHAASLEEYEARIAPLERKVGELTMESVSDDNYLGRIAVGMPVTGHPPHRPVRAQFGHTVLTSGT